MLIFIYLFILAGFGLIYAGAYLSKKDKPRLNKVLPLGQSNAPKTPRYSILAKIFPFNQALLEKMRLDMRIKQRLDAGHLRMSALEFFNLKLLLMTIKRNIRSWKRIKILWRANCKKRKRNFNGRWETA